jgi:hypothetical protein
MNRSPQSIPPILIPEAKVSPFRAWIWVGILLWAVFALLRGTGLVQFLPYCGFREWTGICCPFCGGTRSMIALSGGDWRDAFVLNPLVASVALGVAVAGILQLMAWPFPKFAFLARLQLKSWSPVWFVVAALVAFNWVYLLLQGR